MVGTSRSPLPATGRRALVTVSNGLWALVLIGLAAFVLHVAGVGGHGLDDFFNNELYDAVMIGAGLSIVLSGLRDRRGRATWLVLGLGVLAWGAGEIYFSVALADMDTPPVPSAADAMYLAI